MSKYVVCGTLSSVDLVSSHVQRALSYIRLLNDHGIDPSSQQVEDFARTNEPRPAEFAEGMSALFVSHFSGDFFRRTMRSADPVVSYLVGMSWVTISGSGPDRVHITDVGRALVTGLESEGNAERPTLSVADVALDPTDPLVWTHLTRVVGRAGEGLLVDPFFKADFVPWLVESTMIRRVLVSGKHRQAEEDLKVMAVALATIQRADELEVRSTKSKELHDRCVIGADGSVYLLGSSFNGVGTNLTAVIQPDPDVARVYTDRCEAVWADASVVAPQAPGVGRST